MLVTEEQSNNDSLRARPMHLVQDEYDGMLYFFTPKEDAKVFEIQKDKDVCITFSDPANSVYVSMTGKAQLCDDKNLIDKYWNEWAAAWFEDGKHGAQIGRLKVKIKRGEHWNTRENKLIQKFEIEKAKNKQGTTPDIVENEKFGVHN